MAVGEDLEDLMLLTGEPGTDKVEFLEFGGSESSLLSIMSGRLFLLDIRVFIRFLEESVFRKDLFCCSVD